MNPKEFGGKAAKAAALMKSLSNPHRLMILCMLSDGECPAGALEDVIPLKQSALSQHLARLRKDGLVVTRREKQLIHYRLADTPAVRILQELHGIYCAPKKK